MKKLITTGLITLFAAVACQDDDKDENKGNKNQNTEDKVVKTVTDEQMFTAFKTPSGTFSCSTCHGSTFGSSIDSIKTYCANTPSKNKFSNRLKFNPEEGVNSMPPDMAGFGTEEKYNEWLESDIGVKLTTWAQENDC